uniref:Uncharacterized protein n=1 Tax=Callorhinchus milii TaxID=7868 RepID=A0A4W3JTG5_CALMI
MLCRFGFHRCSWERYASALSLGAITPPLIVGKLQVALTTGRKREMATFVNAFIRWAATGTELQSLVVILRQASHLAHNDCHSYVLCVHLHVFAIGFLYDPQTLYPTISYCCTIDEGCRQVICPRLVNLLICAVVIGFEYDGYLKEMKPCTLIFF